MAKASFADKDPADKKAEEPKAEVATQSTTELAQTTSGIVGEIESEDLQTPRINCANPLSKGELSQKEQRFDLGDLALDKKIRLAPAEAGVLAIILTAEKCYEEDLPFEDDGPEPRRWHNKSEVVEAGFSTQFGAENYARQRADFRLLVQIGPHAKGTVAKGDTSPGDKALVEEAMSHALYKIGEHSYAPAVLTVTKSSFTSAYKPLVTAYARQLQRRELPLWMGKFSLKSDPRANAKGEWWVPAFTFRGIFEGQEKDDIQKMASELGLAGA